LFTDFVGKHKLVGATELQLSYPAGAQSYLGLFTFRNILPGRLPTASESSELPATVRMFFGTGLMETEGVAGGGEHVYWGSDCPLLN